MWFARSRERAEHEARAAWLDAAAVLEARSRADFRHVQEANLALTETLAELRADFARRDAQLSATLNQLGAVCATLAERIETDRQERHELVQTIGALAAALAERNGAPAGQLIGGSVFGERDEEATDDAAGASTIDLVAVELGGANGSANQANQASTPEAAAGSAPAAEVAPAPGDEVRCRFGDRWVEGFEVLEVHSREGRARCRVRRCSDGSIVRKLFETRDLEIVTPSSARAH